MCFLMFRKPSTPSYIVPASSILFQAIGGDYALDCSKASAEDPSAYYAPLVVMRIHITSIPSQGKIYS